MADEELRSFSRRADPEEESPLLLARVRSGELSEGRLRLAAFLGHEASRAVLGDQAPPQVAASQGCEEHDYLMAWIQSVAQELPQARAKACAICSELLLTYVQGASWHKRLTDLVATIQAFADSPSSESKKVLMLESLHAMDVFDDPEVYVRHGLQPAPTATMSIAYLVTSLVERADSRDHMFARAANGLAICDPERYPPGRTVRVLETKLLAWTLRTD